MSDSSLWQVIERPGYFGSRRDEIQRGYDARYGRGNWRLAWRVGEAETDWSGMVMLYEDAYYHFLMEHPQVLAELLETASDVYDDSPSNLASGLDYARQESGRTHVQDIAIRRVVLRLGRRFHGPTPVQIRDSLGEHPLSMTLSPGQVPFHRPELIERPELAGWWLPGSVESFYQSNKTLQVRAGRRRRRGALS